MFDICVFQQYLVKLKKYEKKTNKFSINTSV